MIKAGAGKLTLNGTNTYTGGTTIIGGTLQAGSTTGFSPSSAFTVNSVLDLDGFSNTVSSLAGSGNVTNSGGSAATLTAGGDGTSTVFSGTLTNGTSSLALTKSGGGTMTLTGANTYDGGTTITAGTLQIGNGGMTGSIVGDVIDNGNLVFNRSDEIAFTGAITGSGSLTQMGPGSLNLTGVNTYTGGTTVTGGGSLQINAPTDATLGTGGMTLEGGTIQTSLDGFTSSRAIELLPSLLPNTLATGTFDTATYSGIISGTGGLTIGRGTVILSHANTYSGGTTVTNGTLMVSDDTNFGAQNIGITLFGGEIVSTVEGFFSPRPILLMEEVDFPNVLAAGDGTTGSYGGVISGNSSLQIGSRDGPEATGIVRLSGANTYTGGTVVTAGATLSIGADSALGAAGTNIMLQHGELLTTTTFSTIRPINLERDSAFTNILAAAGNTTMTYQGIITGNGPLQIGDGGNSGTIVFRANNTYIGDTTVATHAVLAVDKDSELGDPGNGIKLRFGGELLTTADFITGRSVNLNPPIVGPAIGIVTPLGPVSLNILAAAPNTTVTYTGLVFGTGGLAIGDLTGNAGTVTLTDVANSYTGGTIIQGGATLSVAGDPILGDQSGSLTLRGGEFLTTGAAFISARAITVGTGADILAAASGTTANYTGVLSNLENQGGTLLIGDPAHPGTVILSGPNTYTGGTILQAGTLLVNNAQALGTGDVAVIGGVLAADPQPINVGGNYTQSAAGTLQLSVAGRAAGQFDTLNVQGDAGLNGTLALVNQGFHPQGGDRLQLITTGGVVTSRFATFQNPFTLAVGFNTVDLIYARQSVTLVFLTLATPVTPLPPGTPGAPGAPEVIETTDFRSFAFTPNEAAAASLLDAVQLDPKAARLVSFLNQEPLANLQSDLQKISPESLSAFYEISFSNANIQKLTLESRLDDLHSGSNGFTSNMNVNGSTVHDIPNPDGKSTKAVMEPVLQHAPENRWGVWVTGFGDFVNVDGDGNAQGYNFTTGGVSVGLDYRITDQLVIGVFGDYSHTWTSLNPGGHIDVDSGRGGLYATWFSHGLYLNAAIYGGHNSYDSGRASLAGLANGGTEGAEWSTFIGGGYDFHFGPLTVGPIASLQYSDVGIDSFDEKGSLAPLDVHSGSAESLRSDAGFRAFYQWQIGKLIVEPSLKAAWEHEYKYSALPITAGFAGIAGPSAKFFGPSEGHDSAVVSAGVSVQVTPAISTYVNYDGQLGRGNYDSNAVTGGVKVSF